MPSKKDLLRRVASVERSVLRMEYLELRVKELETKPKLAPCIECGCRVAVESTRHGPNYLDKQYLGRVDRWEASKRVGCRPMIKPDPPVGWYAAVRCRGCGNTATDITPVGAAKAWNKENKKK